MQKNTKAKKITQKVRETMHTVTMQYAREHQAELVEKVYQTGEPCLITKFGKPKVAMVPLSYIDDVSKYQQFEMEKEHDEERKRAYAALDKMQGMAKGGYKTLSQDIDEILYGENGAWRGSNAKK